MTKGSATKSGPQPESRVPKPRQVSSTKPLAAHSASWSAGSRGRVQHADVTWVVGSTHRVLLRGKHIRQGTHLHIACCVAHCAYCPSLLPVQQAEPRRSRDRPRQHWPVRFGSCAGRRARPQHLIQTNGTERPRIRAPSPSSRARHSIGLNSSSTALHSFNAGGCAGVRTPLGFPTA